MTLELYANSLKQLYSYIYEKTYLAVHFTKGFFFFQIVDRKVLGLIPKYTLLAGDTNHVSIIFLA